LWIHALEINGYRRKQENRDTVALAHGFDLPLISGGDRHGRVPNALLNVTCASTMSEFVEEIRYDKVSSVLLMPEYFEHVFTRTMEGVADVLRYYPGHPEGMKRWTDRVFMDVGDGLQPLTHYWRTGGPIWVKAPLGWMCLMGNRQFRPAIRMVL